MTTKKELKERIIKLQTQLQRRNKINKYLKTRIKELISGIKTN